MSGTAVLTNSSELSWQHVARADAAFAHKRALIKTSDTAFLVAAIAALEGSAQSIHVLPDHIHEDVQNALLGDQTFDVVFSEITEILKIQSVRNLEEMFSIVTSRQTSSTRSEASTVWNIPTSGTTGAPKLVTHSWKSLTSATRKANRAPASDHRWGLLYDHSRFAGLQVIVQAFVNENTLLAPAHSLPLAEKVAFLAEHGCSHLSATPTFWRKILMLKEAADLRLSQITLGGEAPDRQILDVLAKRFPAARITHIYASTEAGVGFAVNDRKPGFPATFLDTPQKTGIELRIRNDRLEIKNSKLMGQYADGQNFVVDGWIDTGDLVEIVGNRVLIKGRANGLINVGGDKVMPSEIRDVLLGLAHVHDVHVYAKPNPITGYVVGADIVLEPISEQNQAKSWKREILTGAREHLKPFQVPRFVRFVSEIVVNETGKAKL